MAFTSNLMSPNISKGGGLSSLNPFAQSQFPAQGMTSPAPSFGSSFLQNQFAQPTMTRLQPDVMPQPPGMLQPFRPDVMPQPPGMLQPFKPADQAAPTKDMYDSWTPEQKSEWDRYGEFGKLQPIDMLRPPVMLPQPIDMPRPPVMLPLPGQENPYPVDPIRPEVMPRPGIPEVTPRPGPQPMLQPFKPRPLSPMQTPDQLGTLTSLLPRDPNRFAQTMRSDEERLRPPSIQLSRKHGGSLSQTVLNLLRNLSQGDKHE